jgi:hypothetical protein
MHTGFQAMHLTLKNSNSYNLTAFLDLAKQSPNSPSLLASKPSSNQIDASTVVVTILKTPTGYLRVHEKPIESSSEISRAFVGREYPFEAFSPLKDWIEINLNASQSGWILSRYATTSGALR